MKTLLYTSSNFAYDISSSPQSKVLTLLNSINFEDIHTDHLIKLKPILDQVSYFDIYTTYIKTALNRNDKTLNLILMEIWTQLGPDVFKLPISIHEKCIEINTVIFEKTTLFAISSSKIKDLIDLCSKSPSVFQTCSSIFNELLIKLNYADNFLEFLIDFVNNVSLQCKNNIDIIDMYPFKCRSILILRAIKNENSSLVSNHYLNEEFKKLATLYPKGSMCLLSHFPDLFVPN